LLCLVGCTAFTAPCCLPAVLCLQLCTLSASGGDLLNAFPPGPAPLFDVVVVDEAAQALEPATLIPFQLVKPGKTGHAGCGC
jgi:superfamily I DNA and/or RNA helicase